MTTHTEVPVVSPGRPREFAKRPFRLSSWARDTGWRHPIAIVAVIFAVFPLLYVVSASLNPSGSLVGSNPLFATVDCSGFAALFANPEQPYGLWFLNSLVISLLTSVATVFLGAMAAYAFSRMRFRGRRIGLLALILIQMFSQFLAVVALFLLLSAISDIVPALGLGTQLGLIMVYLGGALGVNTCPMYGFFSTVPISIDEAAKIDSASHTQIFFTIILRLVAPILAVVGLLSFIATTGEYVLASIVLTDPTTQTLGVGLYSFVSQAFSNNWSIFAAGAVLAAVPVMIVFLLLQRCIVGGLISGSVKSGFADPATQSCGRAVLDRTMSSNGNVTRDAGSSRRDGSSWAMRISAASLPWPIGNWATVVSWKNSASS